MPKRNRVPTARNADHRGRRKATSPGGHPHALLVSGATSGGDAVHPQTGDGDDAELKAQELACEYLVEACEKAISSLESGTDADPEQRLRALITLRHIHDDWSAVLSDVSFARRKPGGSFTPR